MFQYMYTYIVYIRLHIYVYIYNFFSTFPLFYSLQILVATIPFSISMRSPMDIFGKDFSHGIQIQLSNCMLAMLPG